MMVRQSDPQMGGKRMTLLDWRTAAERTRRPEAPVDAAARPMA